MSPIVKTFFLSGLALSIAAAICTGQEHDPDCQVDVPQDETSLLQMTTHVRARKYSDQVQKPLPFDQLEDNDEGLYDSEGRVGKGEMPEAPRVKTGTKTKPDKAPSCPASPLQDAQLRDATWNCQKLSAFKADVEKEFKAYKGKSTKKFDASTAAQNLLNAYNLKGEDALEKTPRCGGSREFPLKKFRTGSTCAQTTFGVKPFSSKMVDRVMHWDLAKLQKPTSEEDIKKNGAAEILGAVRLISLDSLPIYRSLEKVFENKATGTVSKSCGTRTMDNENLVQPNAMQTCRPFVPEKDKDNTVKKFQDENKPYIFVSHKWNGRETAALRTMSWIKDKELKFNFETASLKKESVNFGNHMFVCTFSMNQCLVKMPTIRIAELEPPPPCSGAQVGSAFCEASPGLIFWRNDIMGEVFAGLAPKATTLVFMAERFGPWEFFWNLDELSEFIEGCKKLHRNWVDYFFFQHYTESDPDPCSTEAGGAGVGAHAKKMAAGKAESKSVHHGKDGLQELLKWAQPDKLHCGTAASPQKDYEKCVEPYFARLQGNAAGLANLKRDAEKICVRACRVQKNLADKLHGAPSM